MSTPNYVWHCPSCGRQVPRKFESCRCGFTRQTGAPEPAAPAVEASPEPARRGPSPLLVGLLLGLAVAAGMLWWLKEEPAPERAAVTMPGDAAAPAADVLPAQPPVAEAELNVPPDTSVDAVVVPSPAAAMSSALEDVVARALPAVASIQAGRGRGTGFFIQRDIVLTNQHVVGDETSVQ